MVGKNLGVSENPSIAIIGGGMSGVNAGVQLKKQGINSFTIFERQADFGGVWLQNKYPGCAVDVPSLLYSFSYDLNTDVRKTYASHAENQSYILRVATKHELHRHTRFSTSVRQLTWREAKGQWEVVVVGSQENTKSKSKMENPSRETQEILYFQFVILASGPLSEPNVPRDLIENFKGPAFHSAQWDDSIDLAGKTVAVIGSGASAAQIIPAIAPKVKILHSIQRQPAWVLPSLEFSDESLARFSRFPWLAWLIRWILLLVFDLFSPVGRANSWLHRYLANWAEKHLDQQLAGHDNLKNQLRPDYRFFCKPFTLSSTYLAAFLRPNVKLHRGGIQSVQGRSIVTCFDNAKSRISVDVLILATGFRVRKYFGGIRVIGRDGRNVADDWTDQGPTAYVGIVSHVMPNLFLIFGPLAGCLNSATVGIELQVKFAVRIISRAIERKVRVVEVKESAVISWVNMVRAKSKETVWETQSCGSYMVDAKGRLILFLPMSCTRYYFHVKGNKEHAFLWRS